MPDPEESVVRISEIFHSIQGEGSLTGVPSVFIRTSGCNLRCTWCDTPYASWAPEGPEMQPSAIVEEVETHGSRHVVLTGGEPMVAKGIHELAGELRARGRHITIETAATVPPAGIACDLASLSPKLSNSNPADDDPRGNGWGTRHEALRLQPAVIKEWICRGAADYQLKFVVSSPTDLEEIDTLLDEIGLSIPPDKVFLMPEGVSVEAIAARAKWLIDLCLQRGFRYASRLHIELFGNTRGT